MKLEFPISKRYSIADVYRFLIERQRERERILEAVEQAADEAMNIALDARQAGENGDQEQAKQLHDEFDQLWDVIEKAIDETNTLGEISTDEPKE